MKTIYFGILGCALLVACDGNNDGGKTTTNPTTTNQTDATNTTDGTTTTGDSSNPTNEEIDVGPTNPGTVKALQAEAGLVDCVTDAVNGFVEVNPTASVTGAIVVSKKFNANGDEAAAGLDGYYIADAEGGTFSGIKVTVERAGAFDGTSGFNIGEKVDVAGQLQEFFCLTQLKATTITATGTGDAPAPLVVTPAAIAEAHESVLVKVEGVTIEPASAAGGLKIVGADVSVNFSIADGFIDLAVGGKYDIVGVVGFAFDKWQLLPRNASDITVIELPQSDTVPISSLQDAAISKACSIPAVQFQNGATDVAIEGVVVVGNFAASGADAVIVSDGTQNPNSAIMVRFPTGSITLVPGDNIKAVGDHSEFFCNAQLNNAAVTKTDKTVAVPAPLPVANNEANLEQYESMLVEFSNVTAGTFSGTPTFVVSTDAGVGVDAAIMGIDNFDDGAAIVGKTLTKLRGIIRFSRDTFRVSPRSATDWEIAQ